MSRKDSKNRVLKEGEVQRADGRYMYRWTDYFGKRKTIYAPTLNELRKKEQKVQVDLYTGIHCSDMTLNDYREIVESSLSNRKSTKKFRDRIWNKEFKDTIGKKKLCDISRFMCRRLIVGMVERNLARNTIKDYFSVLSTVLYRAYLDDLVRRNFAEGLVKEYARAGQTERKNMTEVQKEMFVDAISDMNEYKEMIIIMLETGMRFSEALGITMKDIDFPNRLISVNKQLLKEKGGHRIEKTKSGKNRFVPISQECENALLHQIKKNGRSKVINMVDGISNFIFINHKGEFYTRHNISSTCKRTADKCRKVDSTFPNVTAHILRHTFATLKIEEGANVNAVSSVLGHADVATTSLYVHANSDIEFVKKEILM